MSKTHRQIMKLSSGNVITIREIENQHPGSVWCSLIERANWLNKLDISKQAKRLTLLRGKPFIDAVEKILKRF